MKTLITTLILCLLTASLAFAQPFMLNLPATLAHALGKRGRGAVDDNLLLIIALHPETPHALAAQLNDR